MSDEPEPQTVQSTSESGPPGFVLPYSQDLLARAQQLSQQPLGPLPTPEQQVAGFTPEQLQAFSMGTQRATAGSPLMDAAKNSLMSQIGSGPFDPLTNQLVSQSNFNILDAFNTQVAPKTSAIFNSSGVYGSTPQQEIEAAQRYNLAGSLGANETNIRNQALSRQLNAIGQAPGFAQADYNDINYLTSIGQAKQNQQQALQSALSGNILTQRQDPITQLGILGSAINTAGSGYGSVRSTEQKFAPSSGGFADYLGGAGALLGGAGTLAGVFTGNPALAVGGAKMAASGGGGK